MNKFWMVLKNSGQSVPVARHKTWTDACAEASRLCKKHDEPFYVLEAVGIVTPPEKPNSVYRVLFEEGKEF